MKFITLFYLSSIGLLTGCSALSPIHQPMFAKSPHYGILNDTIKNNAILLQAPPPQVKVLDYEANELTDNQKYSRYQIRLAKTTQKLTEYYTTEISHGATLHGHGIGYGGIISIASIKQGDLYRSPNYYKKYQWTSISNTQGQLFPLKVGNKLTFDYTDLAKIKAGGPNLSDTGDQGKIVYEVLAHQNGYKNQYVSVPGDVYMIKFSKSTAENSSLMPQNIYLFSEKLGWYIYAKYFFGGKAMVEYKLVRWRL